MGSRLVPYSGSSSALAFSRAEIYDLGEVTSLSEHRESLAVSSGSEAQVTVSVALNNSPFSCHLCMTGSVPGSSTTHSYIRFVPQHRGFGSWPIVTSSSRGVGAHGISG